MAKKTEPKLDVVGLAEGLLEDLRQLAASRSLAEGRPPEFERTNLGDRLGRLERDLAEETGKATKTVEEKYEKRRDEAREMLEKRRRGLESFEERKEEVQAPSEDGLVVAGRITERQTGAPLPYVKVRLEGLSQVVRTDLEGFYRIEVSPEHYAESGSPEAARVEVLDANDQRVYRSHETFSFSPGSVAYHDGGRIAAGKLPQSAELGLRLHRSRELQIAELRRRTSGLRLDAARRNAVVTPVEPVQPSVAASGEAVSPAPPARPEPTEAARLRQVRGIGPAIAGRLVAAGITRPAQVARLSADKLAATAGIAPGRARAIREAAKKVTTRRKGRAK